MSIDKYTNDDIGLLDIDLARQVAAGVVLSVQYRTALRDCRYSSSLEGLK